IAQNSSSMEISRSASDLLQESPLLIHWATILTCRPSARIPRGLGHQNLWNNRLCNAIAQTMAIELASKQSLLLLCLAANVAVAEPTKNGFNLSNATVPAAEILPG